MQAVVHFRLASFEDLLTEAGELIENKIYFERSLNTGKMEGPYENLTGDTWTRDIITHILYKMVYVPHFEPVQDGLSCTMLFKEALPEDLKDRDQLKYNFSWYLLANDTLNGPFLITKTTNTKDLKYYLDNKRVFVLAHRSLQEFREINNSKQAS